MFMARKGILVICGFCVAMVTGCVSGPYQFGHGWQMVPEAAVTPSTSSVAPQICEGQPNKVIDAAGWVLGIPGKILLFDSRVDNHAVSVDTTLAIADYLAQNQLPDVCVRVNEYAPGEEWRRLGENQHVGAGWRYTIGTLSLIGYTLIPGRLVGGDHYNPYTNSVYVYSDVPSLAIKAAAYAKDVHQRELPGTYAAANGLPVLSLWHETVNTLDALGYVREVGDDAQQAEARRILYPSYAMSVGGAFGGFIGVEPIVIAGSAVVGHVSGRLPTPSASPPAETSAAPTKTSCKLPPRKLSNADSCGKLSSPAADLSLTCRLARRLLAAWFPTRWPADDYILPTARNAPPTRP